MVGILMKIVVQHIYINYGQQFLKKVLMLASHMMGMQIVV